MAIKKLAYLTVPFTDTALTKTSLTSWFRQNKFTIKVSGNTLTVNRKTAIEPVRVVDEIQMHFPQAKRISNVSVNLKGIAIKIDAQLTGNAGQANEYYLVNTINHFCDFLGPIDVRFIDKRNKSFVVKNVLHAEDVGTDTKDNKKADVVLTTKANKKIPISLKQENASFFGSIDAAFKELFRKAVNYALSKRLLESHEFNNGENRIKPHLAIEPTEEEQTFFLFGSDIIKQKGAIIKQSFDKNDFEHVKENQIDIHVERIWQSLKDFEDKDKAAIEIRNQVGRNRSDKEISGLRVLATLKTKIPKNAIWLDRKAFA
jgi:hypothetical protein